MSPHELAASLGMDPSDPRTLQTCTALAANINAGNAERAATVKRLRIAVPPPRVPVTAVRPSPCEHCPSAGAVMDPEARACSRLPMDQRLQTVFTCGWTPGKLCRGYIDALKLDPQKALDVAQQQRL